MRIAFYAPLKSPDHPVPSGDREIARLLLRALALGGHQAMLASRLRSFDGRGDAERQARLAALGARVAERLITRLRTWRPDVWFTYHVHHKAPDLLGPAVSGALRIPYVIAEASTAPRQRTGRWAAGHAHALAAIRAADTIVFLNPEDVPQVCNARGVDERSDRLDPFIDVASFTANLQSRMRVIDAAPVRLVTVAMMRDGAKLASYRTLATALTLLRDVDWKLDVIGDGAARAEVEAAFEALRDRVAFAGALAPADIAARLRASDVFVWPAVDEAIGIVFLEAQACGIPVVGGNSQGVAGVVADGRTGLLVPPGDGVAFAAATRRLMLDPSLRERMGNAARTYVRECHDLPAAAAQLDAILREVVLSHRPIAVPAC